MSGGITPFQSTDVGPDDHDAILSSEALAATLAQHAGLGVPPVRVESTDERQAVVISGDIFSLALRTLSLRGADRPVLFEIGPEQSRISLRDGRTAFWVDFGGVPDAEKLSFEGQYGPLSGVARLWHRTKWSKELRFELYPEKELLRICDQDLQSAGSSWTRPTEQKGYLGVAGRLYQEADGAEGTPTATRSAVVPAELLTRVLRICCMFAAQEGRDGTKDIWLANGRAIAGKVRGACIVDAPGLTELAMTISSNTAQNLIRALQRMGRNSPITWHDYGDFQVVRDGCCAFRFPVKSTVPDDPSLVLSAPRRVTLEFEWEELFRSFEYAALPDLKGDASVSMWLEGQDFWLEVNTDRGRSKLASTPEILHLGSEPAPLLEGGPPIVPGPLAHLSDLQATLSAFKRDKPVRLSWLEAQGRLRGLLLEADQDDHLLSAVLPVLAPPTG